MRGPDFIEKPEAKAIKEWKELAAPLMQLGFILHAFDPSVQFRCPDSGRVIDLPVCAVERINAALQGFQKG